MEALPPPTAYVAIDEVAWAEVKRIRWPSGKPYVVVYEGSSDSSIPLLRVPSRHHVFRMGQHDDRLVVVMGLEPGINGGKAAWDFLAAHESFHLAAQYYGGRVPSAYIEIDENLVKKYSADHRFEEIYDAVDEMHRSVQAGTHAPPCERFSNAYRALDDGAKIYFSYKAFWEWPAEFYAYKAAFEGSLAEYEVFRARLFADDAGYRLFTAGVKLAELVELKLGRPAWQGRAAQGESMLAIFSVTYGCEIKLDESFTVTVDRLDLP